MQKTKITWTLIRDLWDDGIIAKWLLYAGVFISIPLFTMISVWVCCAFLMAFADCKKRYIVALCIVASYVSWNFFPRGYLSFQ